jgi:MscS family membrane protein
MNELLSRTYLANTLTQWLIAAAIITGAILLARTAYWVFGRIVKRAVARTGSRFATLLVDLGEEPLVYFVTIIGIRVAYESLTTTPGADAFAAKVFFILFTIAVGWFLTRLSDALFRDYLKPLVAATETDLDDQLLPIARKAVKITIWVLAAIIALSNAGYDVAAIIAGLGLGGLAFALAAQDTVANLFGGFTVLTDAPFKMGERVQVAGLDGTIEEIGLRSTRLTTLEGRTVTVPNSTFTKNAITNVTSEPSRKVVLNLGLTYDTAPGRVQRAMALLEEIVAARDDLEDKVTIGFNAFGDSALNVLFIYYIKRGADIVGAQTAVNLAILERFNAEGLEFAFPTQTVHLQSPVSTVS